MYAKLIKPIFDRVTAALLLIIFMPLIVIVALLLSISLFGSPFFLQERPGRNERIFKILKFKTMNDDKDDKGILLPDEQRLTMVGKIVRKLSLDELPQLINVIIGDMSFVGPRPLLPEYLPYYTEEQKMRHMVKPGITGLAQVKGRNTMIFSDRLKFDVYYVENQSFLLDLKILLLTIYTVFFKSKTIIPGQTVDEIDDIGLSRDLSANHFKKDKE